MRFTPADATRDSGAMTRDAMTRDAITRGVGACDEDAYDVTACDGSAPDFAACRVVLCDAPDGPRVAVDAKSVGESSREAAAPDVGAHPRAAVDAGMVGRWCRELMRGLDDSQELARGAREWTVSDVASGSPDVRAEGAAGPSAAQVDLIAALEALKSAACALQAEAAVALDRAERNRQALEGVPARRRGLGVAAQVGLARRESPHRGAALLGAAKVWLAEMPHTFCALRAGRLSEYGAMLLVQETACLEAEDRREVDALLCSDLSALEGVGTRQLVASARGHAARLDPSAVVRRARRAESERCVTLRPAPDTMTYLTALLPVAQGVAVYAALGRAADAALALPAAGAPQDGVSGDGPASKSLDEPVRAQRGRGQIMADTLVELVTGQSSASAVPVTVNLVISDSALLGAGHEPGHLPGGGPVPAQVARELVAAGINADAAWLRRLYADPGSDLVSMTSRARFYPDGLAEFLRIRDQGICRTPYCGAPVRHIDHIVPAAAGGPTTAENGEGLCVACNLAKEAPGWARRPVQRAGPGHAVLTTTPTGHQYLGRAPSLPTPSASAEFTGAEGLRARLPGGVPATRSMAVARAERDPAMLAGTSRTERESDVGVARGPAARESDPCLTIEAGARESHPRSTIEAGARESNPRSTIEAVARESNPRSTIEAVARESDSRAAIDRAAHKSDVRSVIDVCFSGLVAEYGDFAA